MAKRARRVESGSAAVASAMVALPGKMAMSRSALRTPAHRRRASRPAAQKSSASPLIAMIARGAGSRAGTRAAYSAGRSRCSVPLPMKSAASQPGAIRRSLLKRSGDPEP